MRQYPDPSTPNPPPAEQPQRSTPMNARTDRNGSKPLSAEELARFRADNPLDGLAKIALAAWVNVRPDQLPPAMQAHTCPATMEAWGRVAAALEEAVLAAAPQTAPEDDWRNDPSADERWNAGCDYAMTALCKLLRINADDVTWDAATEEMEGDVLAVLGNILTVRFGDDWRKAAPQPAELCQFCHDAGASSCACPQPAPEQGMTRAEVGQMLDAKRHDRDVDTISGEGF